MKTKSLTIHYQVFSSTEKLEPAYKKIIDAAKNARLKAYAPYSEYCVGTAILLDNGTVVEGNNQENAAFPSGMCAERVALFYAGAQYPKQEVIAIAITAFSAKGNFADIPYPCGGCRQVMLEMQNRQKNQIKVIIFSEKGNGIVFDNVAYLLPFSFETARTYSE